MQKELPVRKLQRLKGFDYSQNGCYFLTVCTHDRNHFFCNIIENKIELSEYGEIVKNTIIDLPNHNDYIEINNFTIMPNHIHMIISIHRRERFITVPNNTPTVPNNTPTVPNNTPAVPNIKTHGIPEIIRQLKTFSSKRINEFQKRNGCEPFPTHAIWQKSYHDHIIRNNDDYQRMWQYIDENPVRWSEDKYYE